MRDQARLLAAAARIEQLAERGADGIGGIALQDGTLVLYWNGQLPAPLSATLDDLRRTVRIEVHPAQHSRRELDAAARQMSLDPTVDSAGVLSDATGLWVSYRTTAATDPAPPTAPAPPTDPAPPTAPAPPTDPAPTAPEPPPAPSSFPVTVYPPGASIPAAFRWDDAPPFLGGGAITNETSMCTTGFAARATKDGKEYMTLSNHCGANANWHYPQGAKLPVGRTGAGVSAIDANLLSPPDSTTTTYAAGVYVGQYNNADHLPVDGLTYPAVGTKVCFSGALSGLTCDSTIVQDRAYVNGIGPGFWTEQRDHKPALGNGDSGGPTLAASTGSGVTGIGVDTIIDGNKEVPCQGIVAQNRHCSWRAFSTSLPAVLSGLGLTLKTSANGG